MSPDLPPELQVLHRRLKSISELFGALGELMGTDFPEDAVACYARGIQYQELANQVVASAGEQ